MTVAGCHSQTRRRGRTALRWIMAHAFGHPRVVAMVLVGAFGNAALAAAVPVLIGQAFSLLQDDPSRWPELLPLALMMAGTQVVRGLLQFGRNFGADLLGQRLDGYQDEFASACSAKA
jgi:ATP-binding cassette subfamily B protein